jgi:hypothetical protein
MAQNEYHGKWSRWLHKVSNGRWIVAEQRGEYWFSKCAELPPSQEELRGHNVLDLVGKGCRTYANPNSAIKALRRVYNPDDASQARPKE